MLPSLLPQLAKLASGGPATAREPVRESVLSSPVFQAMESGGLDAVVVMGAVGATQVQMPA